MRRNNKQALYESIMCKVSKQVKNALNEGCRDSHDAERWYNLIDRIGEEGMLACLYDYLDYKQMSSFLDYAENENSEWLNNNEEDEQF